MGRQSTVRLGSPLTCGLPEASSLDSLWLTTGGRGVDRRVLNPNCSHY